VTFIPQQEVQNKYPTVFSWVSRLGGAAANLGDLRFHGNVPFDRQPNAGGKDSCRIQ
jgi:hypothetical protein